MALILGVLGRGPPKPLYLWVKSTRPRARLDLQGIFDKHADSMDALWAEYVDAALEGKPRRLAA